MRPVFGYLEYLIGTYMYSSRQLMYVGTLLQSQPQVNICTGRELAVEYM